MIVKRPPSLSLQGSRNVWLSTFSAAQSRNKHEEIGQKWIQQTQWKCHLIREAFHDYII